MGTVDCKRGFLFVFKYSFKLHVLPSLKISRQKKKKVHSLRCTPFPFHIRRRKINHCRSNTNAIKRTLETWKGKEENRWNFNGFAGRIRHFYKINSWNSQVCIKYVIYFMRSSHFPFRTQKKKKLFSLFWSRVKGIVEKTIDDWYSWATFNCHIVDLCNKSQANYSICHQFFSFSHLPP